MSPETALHQRVDTAAAETGAGMFNELSGLGGLSDKGAAARPNTSAAAATVIRNGNIFMRSLPPPAHNRLI